MTRPSVFGGETVKGAGTGDERNCGLGLSGGALQYTNLSLFFVLTERQT